MLKENFIDVLERSPIIAAVHNSQFEKALTSPVEVIFCLEADIFSIKEKISAAHNAGKIIFIHIDLAEGIGKDKKGVMFLKECGVDGIISTRANIIRTAKDIGLFTVQRFFALDTQGLCSIDEMLMNSQPDFIEIMPGILSKVIKRFSNGVCPVIAGGLIETKQEVTLAISSGAFAVSTGKSELWYL